MEQVQTHYPQLVKLLELMRSDNGDIYLDSIEAWLKPLSAEELDNIAAGEECEQAVVLDRLPHNVAKALDVILNAAFDGV